MNTTKPLGRIVLTGAHGSGKTTAGTILARRLRARFDDEIGRRMREQALALDPGAHALDRNTDFDDEVVAREFRRDEQWPGSLVVVETWQVGNLAYAAHRSPAVVGRWHARIVEQLARERFATVCLRLTIDGTTALRRLSEPGPDAATLVDFFERVSESSLAMAASLGVPVVGEVDTSGTSVEQTVERLIEALWGVQ